MKKDLGGRYTYISSATTTQVFTGRGTLKRFFIGSTDLQTIKFIDGTSGTTANLFTTVAGLGEKTYELNMVISKGLRIVTGGSAKVTVVWEQ